MGENIYCLASELKELLDHDPRVIRLNNAEQILNNNEEVMALSYQKDAAISIYSDALNHYKEGSEELKKCQRDLFLKKEALDNHQVVKEYLKAYSEVRDLYFQINEILFGDLSLHLKERGNK